MPVKAVQPPEPTEEDVARAKARGIPLPAEEVPRMAKTTRRLRREGKLPTKKVRVDRAETDETREAEVEASAERVRQLDLRYQRLGRYPTMEERARKDLWVPPTHPIIRGLEGQERFFARVVEPISAKQAELYAKSKEKAHEGKHWEGFGLYMAAAGLRFGRGFVAGFTAPVRPLALTKTGAFVVQMIKEPEARKEFVGEVARDPFGFATEVGGGVTGGYVFGRVLEYGSERLGMRKPKTYKLKEVKVPKGEETAATLMPRGTWRKTWEIVRSKKGSVVLVPPGLRGHETVTTFQPMPVYGPTFLPEVLGVVGGTRVIVGLEPKVEDGMLRRTMGHRIRPEVGPRPFQDEKLDLRLSMRSFIRPGTGQPPVVTPVPDVPPISIPDIISVTDIVGITGQRTRMRLVEEQVQEQQQIVAPVLASVQMQRLTLKPQTRLKLRSLKKKPRRRGGDFASLLWGEERIYGVADIEDLM